MATQEIRPIRVDGNIAYVPLTKGYTAIIDAADVPLVEGVNWCALVQGTVYAVRSVRAGGARMIRMHRVIMGDPAGLQIDHRDGDGLNNQRANLRLATAEQNRHNQRLAKDNTSGFKGVTSRKSGTWQAQIRAHGSLHHLGTFATPEAAHAAYCAASASLHGEFGRIG